MLEKLKQQLRNPFFVMGAVVLLLAVKAAIKIFLGMEVNSTMIKGDGVHNIADMVENAVIMVVLVISMRPRSREYSMGRGNTEFFASFVVAIILLGVSFDFIRQSLAGLSQSWSWLSTFFTLAAAYVSQVPLIGAPIVNFLQVEQLAKPEVAGPLFPYLMAITIGSIVLSRIACHYQIAVAKRTGHAILQAAGEEMKADARIEMVTLVGILGQWLFPGIPALEYLFALAVAVVVGKTAIHLFAEAYQALSARTIGLEIDEHLRKMCIFLPGVMSVVHLGTFRVGPLAVVKVTLNTMLDGAIPVMTDAIEKQLRQYVVEQGFLECQVDVTFKRPKANRHRVAYAVVCAEDGSLVRIADTSSGATHIAVADIEFEEIDRVTLHAVPADLCGLLETKRVSVFFVFDEERESASWTSTKVELAATSTYHPAAVGLVRS